MRTIRGSGDRSGAEAGEALDEPVGLEDADVGEAVEDRRSVAPALDETRAAEDGEVLAHVGHLAADSRREVAHGDLAGRQRLEDAEALRIGQGSSDGGVALTVELGRGGHGGGVQHPGHHVTGCASTQVLPGDDRGECGNAEFVTAPGPRRTDGHRFVGDTPAMSDAVRPVSLDEILVARERIARRVHRTPLLSSATAARFVAAAGGPALADGRLYLKAEHLQKTGSFKARGMTNRIATLDADQRARGAITMSAGNAGQAYAWAGREAGVPMTVVMAVGANPTKVAACRGYGAEVVLEGAHVGEAFQALERIRAERGLTFVHPFEDREVIAGHGSVGLEILDDLPDVDVVVVGVGGGGLISGTAAALKALRPGVRVYGVEPVGAAAMSRAFEAGEPVTIEPRTVADGLAAPFAGPLTVAMCGRHLDGLVLLDDATILAGTSFALERMKQVLEPAGAAALAAVLFGRIRIGDGERVAVVASGGNIDVARLGELLAAAAPVPGAAEAPSSEVGRS